MRLRKNEERERTQRERKGRGTQEERSKKNCSETKVHLYRSETQYTEKIKKRRKEEDSDTNGRKSLP